MNRVLLLFLMISFSSFGQVQIGDDIDGETTLDKSGASVSLSSDGTVIAIGASGNDGLNGAKPASGHVRIYENLSGVWTQIGNDIDGENSDDRSGSSVSLSGDGSIVAIGAFNNYVGSSANRSNKVGHVRIYKNISGTWTQIGNDIDGEVKDDRFGWSVSLSSNGTIVAIGAPNNDVNGNDAGYVKLYEYSGGVWTQIGNDILGEMAGDNSGYSVSLSDDGTVVAIGAINNDGGHVGGTGKAGHVRVYQNISGTWTQIGSDIDGETDGDQSGFSLSLSTDGSIVAIGARENDGDNGNIPDSGHVRVYQNISNTWTQLGDDIDGEITSDKSGNSISLSDDGLIIAIGAHQNNNGGQVRVFKNVGGVWVQKGNDIHGEAVVGKQSGYSVSISSDGSIIATSDNLNDGNVPDSAVGHVRIYDLSAVLSNESFIKNYFSIHPNPVKKHLNINININEGLVLKQVNIYNLQSQYLYSVKTSKIDVSKLSSGMYFIEVETNQGKSAKKIIIN